MKTTVRAVMATVDERTTEGWFPVTLAFEEGSEVQERARRLEEIEALAARRGAGSQILYRGLARIQLTQ